MLSVERLYDMAGTSAVRVAESPLLRVPQEMAAELGRLGLVLRADSTIKSLGVLGIERGSGVSAIASMLALVLAEAGTNVVVLDAAESQSQTNILKAETMSRPSGIDPVLRTFRTPWPRTRVVTPANTGQAAVVAAIAEALTLDSLVIVDCPHASTPDALAMLGSLDAVLLVAQAGRSRKSDIQRTVGTLQAGKVRIAGVLVNHVKSISGGAR